MSPLLTTPCIHVTVETEADGSTKQLIIGAAVGGVVGTLVVIILLVTLITCVTYWYLRSNRENFGAGRRLKHEISMPYLVNRGYCDSDEQHDTGTLSTRGPKILILNAPPPNEDKTNLHIYNHLFDEDNTEFT